MAVVAVVLLSPLLLLSVTGQAVVTSFLSLSLTYKWDSCLLRIPLLVRRGRALFVK